MYKKGDYVVYGSQGACLVTDVTRLSLPGCDRKRRYYVLQPVRNGKSTIYCPVDNDKVEIRTLLSKSEAERILEEIPRIEELHVENEKFREEQYKEVLKSSNIRQCIGMVKTLCWKRRMRQAQGKKFTAVDEKYLKETVDLLVSEMAIALETDSHSAQRRVNELLLQ